MNVIPFGINTYSHNLSIIQIREEVLRIEKKFIVFTYLMKTSVNLFKISSLTAIKILN
jgi:hypothetical protein